MEGECFWVSLREEIKVSEFHNARSWIQDGSPIQDSKIQMATIIQLSLNEWVKFFCANGGEGNEWVKFYLCNCWEPILAMYEWVWDEKLRWLNPRWPNSRWLTSSSWVRMNEFESDWISLSKSQSGGRVFFNESERRKQGVWIPQCRSWIQDGRIQYGRNQDGHHHQVESEWMSLSQIKLVCVRIRWGGRVFLNEFESKITKMAEFHMAVARKQDGTIQDDCHHYVRVRINEFESD